MIGWQSTSQRVSLRPCSDTEMLQAAVPSGNACIRPWAALYASACKQHALSVYALPGEAAAAGTM